VRVLRPAEGFLARRLAPRGPVHDEQGFVRKEHVPGLPVGHSANHMWPWVLLVRAGSAVVCTRCGWVSSLPRLRSRATYPTEVEHVQAMGVYNGTIEAFLERHRGCK